MPTPPIKYRYYPRLSSIVSEKDIPDILGFIKAGIINLLNKIYYKDLQYSKSPKQDSAWYSLSIVSPKRIDVEIPGTGIYLLLDPDFSPGSGNISAFPITVEYEWKILAYLRFFSVGNFSFHPQQIFEAALRILNITEEQAIAQFINNFVEPINENISPLKQFVQDINNSLNLNIPTPTDTTTLSEIVQNIYGKTGKYASLAAFSTYLLSNDIQDTSGKVKTYFRALIPQDIDEFIKEVIIPKFRATLLLSAGIEFPRNMLIPVYKEGSTDNNGNDISYQLIPAANPNAPLTEQEPKAVFTFAEALFYADTTQGFGYNMDLVINSISPVQIGNTGLILDIHNLKIDLSTTSNFPEADLDGRPPEFMGVYTEQTDIILPKKWFSKDTTSNQTLKISGKHFLIGTGGISGTIALEAIDTGNPPGTEDYFWVKLGSNSERLWRLGFNSFDITFRQGAVVSSHLRALLEIQKFKNAENGGPARIELLGEWESKENFKLSANFLPDGLKIKLFEHIILTLQTAEIGESNGDFFIGTDTKLSFPENSLAAKLLKKTEIDLPAIRIYANGRFEVAGGVSFIPTNINIPLGPIDISVTGIHLGAMQRQHNGVLRNYNYIGFDGALSVDPIGLDLSGNGVKFYYTTDDDAHGGSSDSFFHISTIELDLVIPGNVSEEKATAIIRGSLTIPEPGVSGEYAGSVSVKLPKAKISGEAAMRFYPKYSAYYVDAGLELPTPIPLGPIGIFGFHGIIGQRYVAEKASIGMGAKNTWYDYYMANPRGIAMQKFSGPPKTLDYSNAFSVGVGASFALTGDERISSLRAMMILSIPSVFIIDAGLTILEDRLGIAEKDNRKAPFYAFVAIGDNSLEFAIGADYQIDKSNGWFMQIHAELQAGFFFKNQRPWYINFGTREKPITAFLFKGIFNIKAQAFLMLSGSGIQAGARVGFDLKLLGIVRLWALIEVGAQISFERPQVGGFIYIEGGAEIDLGFISAGFMLSVYLSLEMVKPFLIFAELRLQFRFKFFFVKIKITVVLPLKWEKNKTVDYTPIAPLTISKVTDSNFPKEPRANDYVKGIHMLTNESFDLGLHSSTAPPNGDAILKTIPLDTFIDIRLEKGVAPNKDLVDKIIGGHTGGAKNSTELIPPQKMQPGGHSLNQVKHQYSIEKIELKSWDKNTKTWKNYNPYKALLDDDVQGVDKLRIGQWQKNNDQYNTIRILGTTPFSFMDPGEPGWFVPEQYGITPSELFCTYNVLNIHRSNFLKIPLGTVYYPPANYPAHFISGAYYTLEGIYLQTFEVDEDGNTTQILSDDKMEVKTVQNPFTHDETEQPYDRSLVFGNGNNLIISPPEAVVKGQLLLTTHAQKITIEFYEKDVNHTGIKPKFDLKETLVKTKQDLNSRVEFDFTNKDFSVSQIRIVPETNDKDRINEILEEIALIYYNAELNNGNAGGIIILTPQEQEAIDALEKELADLKSKSCTDISCESLDFVVLDDFFISASIESIDFIFQDTYFINDNITFQQILQHMEYGNSISVNFNLYSILIIKTIIYNDRDPSPMYGHVTKIADKGDRLCVERVEDKPANYTFFKYSIIRIAKMPEKPIELNSDCGCTENSSPIGAVCTTALQEFNWITLAEYEYQQTIPGQDAVNENTEAMADAINKTIQPIWRPNTKYYLYFQLKDLVNGEKHHTFDYYYGFQTKGPIGHFHKQTDYIESGKKEDEYTITSLKSYIDYRRSYPDADGNLLMSKPLFFGNEQCEINIYFDVPYTPQMFSEWKDYNGMGAVKGEMSIMIKDPVSDTIIPYPLPEDWQDEDVPKPDITWENDNDPRLPLSLQVIINYINYVNEHSDSIHCEANLGDPISPSTKYWSVKLTNLKPEKLYTALIYNAYDANGDGVIENQKNAQGNIVYEESQKVHEFIFRTSRYPNFRAQVESYHLTEKDDGGNIINTKQAVYEIRKEDSSAWANDLYALISGSSTTKTEKLALQYPHEFDRAVEGILELNPLDPPKNTEFIKITDETETLIAILVRNPEPFNDPKIPVEDIRNTLLVRDSNSSGGTQTPIGGGDIPIGTGETGINDMYKVLWSKDYSQALIMNDPRRGITAKNLRFVFAYKTWDGNQRKYIVKDETAVDESLRLNTVSTEPIIFNS
ncbi:MAG: hypothetical protein LBE36_13975 [Flavobacteriaceae bacterium]|jgi:hypothetical protein|nr:hypothetical protein [Flavobacteriaceae bacterium]